MVTADGHLVHASADQHPDLFWGLRGGGGNFGVVTGFDYQLHPVGPEVVGGVVAWPASEASAVLEHYRHLAEQAPPELTLVAMMRPAPSCSWLPKEWHGKPIVALLACYSGDPEQGEAAVVAPIKAFGQPIGDMLVRRSYAELQKLLDVTQPKGRRYYWKSEYLPGVEPALCEKVIEHAGRIRSPHSAVILFQLAGALNRLDNDHSPVGNRNAPPLSAWKCVPQRADWMTGVCHEALEAAQVMEGPTLRSLPTGAGSKPPRAALAEDRCREHRGKRHTHVVCQVRIKKASDHEPSSRCRN
ncbi:FAD-linked oxidase [Thioalkalivibrio paradoxus ARh 1]|uniref:FAD-linked oxidase n=2 Tax=Thioalkalivibrio paradoxus TaxID=108010 RepID=W0DFY1_9GAMM|nr:FAD-linked oxidase [Thioalkalivibrio paradoxus ARh 1]